MFPYLYWLVRSHRVGDEYAVPPYWANDDLGDGGMQKA